MNMLVDVILVAVIAFFTVKFFKIGIFGIACGVLKVLLSLSFAALFGEILSVYFVNDFISKRIDGTFGTVLSLIISYVLLFLIAFIFSSLLFGRMRGLNISIISWLDKIGGLTVGFLIGLSVTTLISNLLFSGLELTSELIRKPEILLIYSDSSVFKMIIDLNFFDLIEKSFSIRR